MARRKGVFEQVLGSMAKARAARERERLREERLARAAAERAAKDAARAHAAQERKQQAEAAKRLKDAERARAAREREQQTAAAKAEREVRQAAAARERQADLERVRAERAAKKAAAEKEKTAAAAARAETMRARDAKIAEAAHRTAAVAADDDAFERLLTDRAGPAPTVPIAAEHRFNDGGPTAMVDAVLRELSASVYPAGLDGAAAADYRPELRELVIELDLPRADVVSSAAGYRYVQARDAIEPVLRKPAETKAIYGRLIARIVLRTLAEAFAASPATIVTRVSINGYVRTKDRATGQPVRPCLISVGAARDEMDAIHLDEPELDPEACLRHLNALVSPHPYDLEPVRPLVTFDLSRYKFVEEMNVVAGLDSRPDLLQLKPVEFEHLVRELFEAMGMKSWVTQASRDDGVDAVVINEDPIIGGLCVIQAKRYSRIVGLEAVNALAGVMDDKHAAKGILVTTSWVGQASREFAARNGRMTIIEGRQLRHLLKENLHIDVLIGLDRVPPDWTSEDLGNEPE